jgi:hypothetical protein
VVGNALVQAVAGGVLAGVEEGRALVERTLGVESVRPEATLAWDEMESRLHALRSQT